MFSQVLPVAYIPSHSNAMKRHIFLLLFNFLFFVVCDWKDCTKKSTDTKYKYLVKIRPYNSIIIGHSQAYSTYTCILRHYIFGHCIVHANSDKGVLLHIFRIFGLPNAMCVCADFFSMRNTVVQEFIAYNKFRKIHVSTLDNQLQ